jgi:DNA sulfur modification protein DndD
MKKYLKKFIKFKLHDKSLSNAYYFCLWALYKNFNKTTERYRSNYIKNELRDLDFYSFPINEKRAKAVNLTNYITTDRAHRIFFNHRTSLNSIQIKNFRGFGCSDAPQDNGTLITFNNRKNIFYAPNGGGKTSLCEAIEYKLTNDIKEATRRKTPLTKYIKRGNTTPSLLISFTNNNITTSDFTPVDIEAYKKCFIERNRIQEFALLGSKDTKTDEKDVIASVLGLEDFDEYISSLVQPTSFNLDTLFSSEAKRDYVNLLENHKEWLLRKEIESEKQKEIIVKLSHLLNKEELQNDDLTEEIKQNRKKIKEIEEEIAELKSSSLDSINIKQIKILSKYCLSKYALLNKLKTELTTKKDEIDFNKLYEAIISIENKSFGECPACGTPISDVKFNPFDNARAELEKLEDIRTKSMLIAELQQFLREEVYQTINDLINKYKNNVNNYNRLKNDTILQVIDSFLKEPDKIEAVNLISGFVQKNLIAIDSYSVIQNKIIDDIASSNKIILDKKNLLRGLNDFLQKLVTLESNLTDSNNTTSSLDNNLTSFESQKAIKKEALKKERKYNRFVKKLSSAYKLLHNDLRDFKIEIERNQLQGIKNNLLKYYKSINKSDSPEETLKSIKIIYSGNNYRIIIKRINNVEEDAFVSLSEGHLRSLGLAIMLAISRKYDVPLIIFDDVVNAIDSDHRANIIDLIYTDPFFSQRQIILTTHDRLFWERFCNSHPNRDNSISYILCYTNKGVIAKQYNIDFDQKISEALQSFDIREALVYCRIWFETKTINYLKEKRAVVSAKYSTRIPGVSPTASLESIYSILDNELTDKQYFDVIKNDLINWAGQNQAHHSFSEDSYNFIHSKTSAEVNVIYNAVKNYVTQIDGLISQL